MFKVLFISFRLFECETNETTQYNGDILWLIFSNVSSIVSDGMVWQATSTLYATVQAEMLQVGWSPEGRQLQAEADPLCKQIKDQMYVMLEWIYGSMTLSGVTSAFEQKPVRGEKCLPTEKWMNEVFRCALLVIQHKSLAKLKMLATECISRSFSNKVM